MEHKTSEVYLTGIDHDQGIIKAIFSVMGNIDFGNDRIHNGAFAKTFAERGHKVKVLDQHRTDSINRAIAKTMHLRELSRPELPSKLLQDHPEASGGAEITAQFSLEDDDSRKAFFRLKNEWVDEWSFGYDAFDTSFTREEQDGKTKSIREIRTIKLYEVSPVLFGMNDATMTTGAKSNGQDESKIKNAFEFWQKDNLKFARLENHDLVAVDENGTELTVLYKDLGDKIEFEILKGGDDMTGKNVSSEELLDKEEKVEQEETEQKEPVQEEQNQETDIQEEKAGRALSGRNEASLRSVIAGLQTAIDSINGMFPVIEDEEEETMELSDELNTLTVEKEKTVNHFTFNFSDDVDTKEVITRFEEMIRTTLTEPKEEKQTEQETDEAGPVDESLDSEEKESPTIPEVKAFDFDKALLEFEKLEKEFTEVQK